MKKWSNILLCCLLLSVLVVTVSAAEGPEITLEPQSPSYTNYGVALYVVKANGTNLSATWYMEWLGTTYNISDTSVMQPWEGFAGELYGPGQPDANTFTYLFEGIEEDLDGAYIWCVIEDGHYDVTSQKVRVSVGSDYAPPNIVDIPARLTVQQGAEAEIRCVAQAPADTQLSFLWYETATGKMEDIQAINRGTEDADYLFCDTSTVGTRYYVCLVETSEGGMAYSSIVPVTVTAKAQPPKEETEKPSQETTEPAEETKDATSPTDETEKETRKSHKRASQEEVEAAGVPWWVLILVAVAAAGFGVIVAVILVKKKN